MDTVDGTHTSVLTAVLSHRTAAGNTHTSGCSSYKAKEGTRQQRGIEESVLAIQPLEQLTELTSENLLDTERDAAVVGRAKKSFKYF